jgi:glucan phosphoethanolaminetransferase (alkaline phosphatase superfamily)
MRLLNPTNSSSISNNNHKRMAWSHLVLLTVSVIYFYVFMEWLFFVTKPSFMDVMEIGKKLEVLLISGLLLTIPCLPFLFVLFSLSSLPWFSSRWRFFLRAGGLLPAISLAVTSLLLVDNFTYTIFRFGVVTTSGIFRGLYALLFLLAFIGWYRWVLLWLKTRQEAQKSHSYLLFTPSVLAVGVIVISLILVIPKLGLLNAIDQNGKITNVAERPNILLIGSDGVNASNMSVYGYERDTTPNLRKIVETSLLAENAFPNSASTSGSLISMLTGKPPTKTRVIYPPNILRDSDSYQHLPGILRGVGYRAIEISVSHYADAYTLNLRNGFDVVNDRSVDQAGFQAFTQMFAFQDIGYFLSVLAERVSDRIFHIFYIKEMSNPYQEVTTNQFKVSDNKRVEELINEFEEAEQPLFIHVHLMGTHGGLFSVNHQVFSHGQTQDSAWTNDFYDDAILQFDDYLGEVWNELSRLGVLDNTLIIIYSDHGMRFQTNQRIPLIFRFPKGEFSGKIRSNVQNLDIAPTILDYLGIPIPKWMEGQSLLSNEVDPVRPIFSAGVAYVTQDPNTGQQLIDLERIAPPFYQFGYLRAIVCQNWYLIKLSDFEWKSGEVTGHTAPCDEQLLPDTNIIQKWMLERLESDGFDIFTLQTFFSDLEFDQ